MSLRSTLWAADVGCRARTDGGLRGVTFDSIDGDLVSLRGKAFIAIMLVGFVRVGAVVKMRVRDFEDGDDQAFTLRQLVQTAEESIAQCPSGVLTAWPRGQCSTALQLALEVSCLGRYLQSPKVGCIHGGLTVL